MGWSWMAACATRRGSRSWSALARWKEARTRIRFRSEVARSLPSAALPKSTTERRSGPKASLADCKKEFRTSAIRGGSCGRGCGVEELIEDLARHGIAAVRMLGRRWCKVNECQTSMVEFV